MWTNVIAIALAVGGAVVFGFPASFGMETNLAFYGKTLLAMLGGGGIALYNNIGLLKNLPSLVTTKVIKKEDNKIFVPEDYEIKDFEAITHLRDRCVQAKSEEGIKICSQLAAILFILDTPKV